MTKTSSFFTLSFCGSVLALSACTTYPIQKMSLKDAVKFGNDQYFTAPNFAFSGTSTIDHFQIQNTDETSKVRAFGDVLNRYMKRMAFDVAGVVNRPTQQYQMISSGKYQAKNLKVEMTFPLVLDGQQKALFIDTSALDGLFNKSENEGKYSRFDWAKLDTDNQWRNKGEQLMGVVQKHMHTSIDHMQDADFVELPLNGDDKRANVVRKIQAKMNFRESLKQSDSLIMDVLKVLKPKSADATGATDTTDDAEMGKTLQDAARATSKIFDPASEQITTMRFDKAGNIVRQDAVIQVTMVPAAMKEPEETSAATESSPVIKMSARSSFNMHDIGTAKLINPPTAENSVDGIENLKGSWLGGTFARLLSPEDEETEAAAGAEAAVDAAAVDAARAATAAVKAAHVKQYKRKKASPKHR